MPEIEGYKVVRLRVSPDAEHCHSIYMREHFIRLVDPTKPKGRTLFVLNIPPYVTKTSFSRFFKNVGVVESVTFAEKPGRNETEKWLQNCTPFSNAQPPYKFKVGYVVFKASSSVSRALQLTSIELFSASTGESFVETGMQQWHSQYKQYIVEEEQTKERIANYMADYDAREQASYQAAKTSETDADGWTTVSKQGRNAGFEQKESVIARLENKIDRSKKTKELTNFYTFQIRESKMQNIIELRKKFEEDKRKIETLKQTRRFRPF